MTTSTSRSIASPLGFSGGRTTPFPATGTPRVDELTILKQRYARELRVRLLIGATFSGALFLAVFYGFKAKPAAAPVAAPRQIIQIDQIKMPVDLEEPTEEILEDTPHVQPMESFAPSQAELLCVPLDVDFVIAAAPTVETNMGRDSAILQIPTTATVHSSGLALKRVFNLSELDRKPELVQGINPTYPPELRNSSIAGTVVVRFIVDPQGAVTRPEIVSSPHPALGMAVVRSITKWRFKAGMKAGRTVSTEMELPVEFALN